MGRSARGYTYDMTESGEAWGIGRTGTLLIGAVLAGLFLGLLGPFGNYMNDGLGLRLVYWIGAMLVGLLVYGGALALIVPRMPATRGGRVAGVVIAVLIASLPQAWVTRTVAFALWPILGGLGLPGWLWYLQVAATGLPLSFFLAWRGGLLEAPEAPVPQPGEGDLADRLPPHLRGPILCLSMEDHYVRVHTARGSTLLLMSFGQAMDELGPAEGLRTHRSWWVARDAVAAVEGTPRAMRLRLANGVEAPVARTAVAALRAAGWLDPISPAAAR